MLEHSVGVPHIPSQPTRAAPNPRRPCWKSGLAGSLHQRNIKGGRHRANHVANPSRHDAVAHSSGLTTTTRLKPSQSRARRRSETSSPPQTLRCPGSCPQYGKWVTKKLVTGANKHSELREGLLEIAQDPKKNRSDRQNVARPVAQAKPQHWSVHATTQAPMGRPLRKFRSPLTRAMGDLRLLNPIKRAILVS